MTLACLECAHLGFVLGLGLGGTLGVIAIILVQRGGR